MAESPSLLTATIRSAFARFRGLPRALILVWSAARGWTLAWLGLLATQGLLPVALVYLTRSLVDRLAAAIGVGATWDSLRPLLVLAALLAATILLIDLLRGITGWV